MNSITTYLVEQLKEKIRQLCHNKSIPWEDYRLKIDKKEIYGEKYLHIYVYLTGQKIGNAVTEFDYTFVNEKNMLSDDLKYIIWHVAQKIVKQIIDISKKTVRLSKKIKEEEELNDILYQKSTAGEKSDSPMVQENSKINIPYQNSPQEDMDDVYKSIGVENDKCQNIYYALLRTMFGHPSRYRSLPHLAKYPKHSTCLANHPFIYDSGQYLYPSGLIKSAIEKNSYRNCPLDIFLKFFWKTCMGS